MYILNALNSFAYYDQIQVVENDLSRLRYVLGEEV